MKNERQTSPGARLLLGLLMGIAGTAALAQDLDRVEVTGTAPVRLDITASCPSVGVSLGDALAGQVGRYAEYGVTDVQLSIGPQGMSEVVTRGGPRIYRSALRRALNQLDCLDTYAGQRFRFEVAFVSPDDKRADQAIAVRPGALTVAAK